MRLLLLLTLACAWGDPALAADPEAGRLPPGAGKEVVAKVCAECHGADNFRKKRLTRDEWSETVDKMVEEGAKATDDEITAIVDYLAQNFSKDSKVWVNTAPLAELKNVLGFTNEEASAILAWRAEKGDFHSAADVQKVPGVDPQKVEAKKEMMAF
jgi:competence ComEA-like helix-hairpin-helix protein